MNALARTLIATALIAMTAVASAGPRHHYGAWYHHQHHHHRASGLGALVVGLAVAVPLIALARQADQAERAPEVVYVPPPPPAPVVYATSRAEPVIYPRNAQSDAQIEVDRRECNRWATTQQAAMSDTSVFNRAVEACMDGRGYTLR